MANEFKDVRVVGGNTVYSIKVLPTAIQEIRAVSAGNKYTIEFTLLSGRNYTWADTNGDFKFDAGLADSKLNEFTSTVDNGTYLPIDVYGGGLVYTITITPQAVQEIRAVSRGDKYTIEFTLISGRTYTYVNSSNEHLFNDLPTAQQEADSLANTIEGLLTVVTDGGGFGEES